MGNQGSPHPSFFYYDDFTSFVVMACFAPLAAPFSALFRYGARFARARSAQMGFAQYNQQFSQPYVNCIAMRFTRPKVLSTRTVMKSS